MYGVRWVRRLVDIMGLVELQRQTVERGRSWLLVVELLLVLQVVLGDCWVKVS